MESPIDRTEFTRLLGLVDAPMTTSEVLGTLTALATAPTRVHPSQWLLRLTGDARFPAPQDARAFLSVALQSYRAIDMALQADEELELPAGSETAAWCRGYFQAARADETWSADADAMRKLLPVALLAGELDRVGDAETPMHSDAMRAKWSAALPGIAAQLYAHWAGARAANKTAQPGSPTSGDDADGDDAEGDVPEGDEPAADAQAPFVRSEAKVGRNAACPCDSGKKHKHCCGRDR